MDEMEINTFPRLKEDQLQFVLIVFERKLHPRALGKYMLNSFSCGRTKFVLCQNAKSSHIEEKIYDVD